MKTYLIEFKNGKRQKITVSADWKVTFGPASKGMNAGTTRTGQNYQIPLALRFYESERKQRAIFTDVVGFRDTSIKIEEEKSKTQEKDGFMECDGVRKRTTFQATVKEWIDPDKHQEELPQLPTDGEIFDLDD